jgi:ribosomal protein S13
LLKNNEKIDTKICKRLGFLQKTNVGGATMARIAGVDLPNEKRAEIGLTYIYGIGRATANEILAKAEINPDTRIKDLSEELGYAREVKMFKQEPEKWKAHVGDVSTVLRVSLTGRQQTPDLYEIMQVLGKESIEKRLKNIIEK